MTADTEQYPLDPERERVQLASAEVIPGSDSEPAKITVTLAAGDERSTVIHSANPEEPGPLGAVAEATLRGLEDLLPSLPTFRILGVERVLAAGMDVLLVAVEAPELTDRSLVGATPVQERDGPEATASATLDAVNRLLARTKKKGPG